MFVAFACSCMKEHWGVGGGQETANPRRVHEDSYLCYLACKTLSGYNKALLLLLLLLPLKRNVNKDCLAKISESIKRAQMFSVQVKQKQKKNMRMAKLY